MKSEPIIKVWRLRLARSCRSVTFSLQKEMISFINPIDLLNFRIIADETSQNSKAVTHFSPDDLDTNPIDYSKYRVLQWHGSDFCQLIRWGISALTFLLIIYFSGTSVFPGELYFALINRSPRINLGSGFDCRFSILFGPR